MIWHITRALIVMSCTASYCTYIVDREKCNEGSNANRFQCKYNSKVFLYSRGGNLRPAGQMRLASTFDMACIRTFVTQFRLQDLVKTKFHDKQCSSHASAAATWKQSRPKQEGKDQASDT